MSVPHRTFVTMARRNTNSSRGRYQSASECANCDREEPRSSLVETELFYSLAFVFGGAERDVALPGDRRVWLDMRFRLPSGFRLGIEFDGAYWHAAREEKDLRKSDRLIHAGVVDHVVRIREAPLRCLGPLDVTVPTKSTGALAAFVAVLHMAHMGVLDHEYDQEAIRSFLRASAIVPHPTELYCSGCFHGFQFYSRSSVRRPAAPKRLGR